MSALTLACPCPGCAARSVRYVHSDSNGALLLNRHFLCLNCKRVWAPCEFQQALAATNATAESPKVSPWRTERGAGTAADAGPEWPESPTAPNGEAA